MWYLLLFQLDTVLQVIFTQMQYCHWKAVLFNRVPDEQQQRGIIFCDLLRSDLAVFFKDKFHVQKCTVDYLWHKLQLISQASLKEKGDHKGHPSHVTLYIYLNALYFK